MITALPFDDFRRLLADLPEGDHVAEQKVRDHFALRYPAADLAGIADLGAWLARWSGRPPRIQRPLVALFAASHGVARHFTADQHPQAVRSVVERLGQGDEPVNRICAANDLGLKVFDLALDLPTGDISAEAALGERDCAATMAFGMEAIAGGTDLLCLGEIGFCGEVAAAAVLKALHSEIGGDWGAGADDPDVAARRMERINAALALHRGHLADPFEVLRRLGGREIAAMAGAILAARIEKIPVILDGIPALAAAAALHAVNPRALAHCRLAGTFGNSAVAGMASRLGLDALLNIPLGSAAGVGAAMAAGVLKSAAAVCTAPPAP